MQSLLITVADQNMDVANLRNPSHSIQEDASKGRRKVLSNVSDDIRPSKMIDIQSLVHMLLIL